MRAFRGSSGDGGGSFLPQDYVRNQTDKRANFLTAVLYVTVMSCVVAAFVFTNREWKEVREEQIQLQEEYVQQRVREDLLVKLETTRREQIERQAVVTALAEPSPRVLLLGELEKARPSDVEYTKLDLVSRRVRTSASESPAQANRVRSLSNNARVTQNNAQAMEERPKVAPPKWEYTLKLEGVSPTNLSVADFIEGLRKSPAFARVDLVYIQDTVRDSVSLRRFELEATLGETPLREALGLTLQALIEPEQAPEPAVGEFSARNEAPTGWGGVSSADDADLPGGQSTENHGAFASAGEGSTR